MEYLARMRGGVYAEFLHRQTPFSTKMRENHNFSEASGMIVGSIPNLWYKLAQSEILWDNYPKYCMRFVPGFGGQLRSYIAVRETPQNSMWFGHIWHTILSQAQYPGNSSGSMQVLLYIFSMLEISALQTQNFAFFWVWEQILSAIDTKSILKCSVLP